MMEAGSGAKHIELEEDSLVLEAALATLAEGVFDFGSELAVKTEGGLVQVIAFFRKYDCQSALRQVAQFINTHCEESQQLCARLLAAMHLERDDLCADLIERYPASFGFLNVAKSDYLQYEIFTLIPSRYYWALAKTNLGGQRVPQYSGVEPRKRFERLLRQIDHGNA